MLDLYGKTRIIDSKEFPIVTGVSVIAEGMAMVSVLEDGIEKIKPTAGEAAERFVGFSYGYTFRPLYKVIVERLVCPAASPYTATLKHTPVSGQIAITNGSTEQVAGTPGALSANEYSISSGVVTFHSGQASLTETITYKYSPSAQELMFEDHVLTTSFTPSEMLQSIGCILKGEVWTDQYDAGTLWTATSTVKLSATTGLLTDTSSNGVTVSCVIVHIPTEDNPFLGIRF